MFAVGNRKQRKEIGVLLFKQGKSQTPKWWRWYFLCYAYAMCVTTHTDEPAFLGLAVKLQLHRLLFLHITQHKFYVTKQNSTLALTLNIGMYLQVTQQNMLQYTWEIGNFGLAYVWLNFRVYLFYVMWLKNFRLWLN